MFAPFKTTVTDHLTHQRYVEINRAVLFKKNNHRFKVKNKPLKIAYNSKTFALYLLF